MRAALDRCSSADFDGHSEFARLTPAQRLDWLAAAQTVLRDFKGLANLPAPQRWLDDLKLPR
jgi:hypothetical protein